MNIPTSGILSLLKNRNFTLLWISQLLTQFADKFLFVLLILIATNRQFTDYPAPLLSYQDLVMISSTLPAILFGSFAGIYVDRHDKFRMMISANIIRAIVVLMLPIFPNSFLYLLLITFIEQIFTQFFAPAEQSAIPLVVDRENLMSANAMIASSVMASLIIGYGIGSPVLNTLTNWFPNIIFIRELFIGGAYLTSVIILLLIPVREEIDRSPRVHLINDLKDSIAYVRQNLPVGGAVLQLMLLYGVLGVLLRLSMNLSQLLLGNKGDFGFFVSGTGIGLTISALILGQFSNYFANRPLPWLGFIGISFSLFLFVIIPEINSFVVALIITVVLGFHTSMVLIPMQTIIHHYTDEAMRGKVFGLLNNGQNIAANLHLITITIVLHMFTLWLGKQLGFQVVVTGCALLVLLGGWLAWRNNRKALEKVL